MQIFQRNAKKENIAFPSSTHDIERTIQETSICTTSGRPEELKSAFVIIRSVTILDGSTTLEVFLPSRRWIPPEVILAHDSLTKTYAHSAFLANLKFIPIGTLKNVDLVHDEYAKDKVVCIISMTTNMTGRFFCFHTPPFLPCVHRGRRSLTEFEITLINQYENL